MLKSKILVLTTTITLILILISTFTTNWSVYKISGPDASVSGSMGLWKICGKSSESVTGSTLEGCSSVDSSGALTFTRIFSITSLVVSILALLLLLYYILKNNSTINNSTIINSTNNNKLFYGSIFLLLSGIFSIIACIIWASSKQTNNEVSKLGYSWYLNLFSGIISILICVSFPLFSKFRKI
jgi:hypothetical protein